MTEKEMDRQGPSGREALCALVRVVASLAGGTIAFALWLAAVLISMPRPPVPPSFIVTLTAPVIASLGFAGGLFVTERFTSCGRTGVGEAFYWPLAASAVGTVAMFPFGGMMAGFGLFGLGTAAILVREVRALRARTRLPADRGH